MKVIIVGGVAGGASCAARLRRLDEKVEILMVEKGPYVSYANCGLPYHVSGVIPKESSLLVASEQMFRAMFGVDARTNCEAISISAENKTVDLHPVLNTELQPMRLIHKHPDSFRPEFKGVFSGSIIAESFRESGSLVIMRHPDDLIVDRVDHHNFGAGGPGPGPGAGGSFFNSADNQADRHNGGHPAENRIALLDTR